MTRQDYYVYIGDNGVVETTVYIPGVPSIKRSRLVAGENKLLTSNGKIFVTAITIPTLEAEQWYEVDDRGQI